MAELRSTDIIGKLRKINQQIQNTNARIDNLDGTNTDVASTQTVVYARVKTLTTNINGYELKNYVLSETLLEDNGDIFPAYKYYTITYANNQQGISFNQAANFLGVLIGSKYLPKIRNNTDKSKYISQPQYSYIVTEEGRIFIPIWRQLQATENLELAELRMYLVHEDVANDITSLAEDQQSKIAPSVKAMKDYVEDYVESQPEVCIGTNQPTQTSCQIWVKI